VKPRRSWRHSSTNRDVCRSDKQRKLPRYKKTCGRHSVIADTSCLIALEKIDSLFLFEQIYGSVLVSPTVKAEYGKELPAFVEMRAVTNPNYETFLRGTVDPGEASTSALALEAEVPLLLKLSGEA
jgi:hypothetical protein